MNDVDIFIQHLSEKPWSMYKASDYSIDQWHNACLIHQHDGPPTSKDQCKLPIKTPNGAVNRNGVYAAAAALAGARGGVDASAKQKTSAASTLARLYKEIGKPPPSSLMKHSNADILEHFGVKGMKWGVRNPRVSIHNPRGRTRKEQRAIRERRQASKKRRHISDADLDVYINRLSKEKKLKDLVENDLNPGKAAAKRIVSQQGAKVIGTVATGATLYAIKLGVEKKFTKDKAEKKKIKVDPFEVAKFVTKGGPGKK